MERYQDINAKTIDRWIEEGWEWGNPISHDEYMRAAQGEWDVFLTPTVKVPKEWFGNHGDIREKNFLAWQAEAASKCPHENLL